MSDTTITNYIFRPNSADCPGADFYTPTRQENSATPHYTGMEMTRYNTRPTFDSTMGRTTDFESEPTWMSDAATNTRGMTKVLVMIICNNYLQV